MKKTILLFVLLAGFSWKGEAQHFIASFGTQHSWGVPHYVSDVIYDNYYDYDWVHARRIVRGGYISFDLILQRGDAFVEVSIGRHGRIRSTRYVNHYPLHDHVCGDYCGFHSNYYSTYYNTCNSHYHHGHNHVIYRPGIRRRVYSNNRYYYSKPYYNKSYHYNKGYRYKGNGHHSNNRSNNRHHNDNSNRKQNNGRSRSSYNKSDSRRSNSYNASRSKKPNSGRSSGNKRQDVEKQRSKSRESKSYYTRRN